jgi:hypothetical protein
MPSSFAGADLFNSGPHRFFVGPLGDQLIEQTTLSPTDSGRQAIGPLDGVITVRGRLVADTDDDLWTLIDAIADKLTDPPTAGDLIDSHSRTFKNISFISFTPKSPIDRGRQRSLEYQALFTLFGNWK